jgi:hypothetical protein
MMANSPRSSASGSRLQSIGRPTRYVRLPSCTLGSWPPTPHISKVSADVLSAKVSLITVNPSASCRIDQTLGLCSTKDRRLTDAFSSASSEYV